MCVRSLVSRQTDHFKVKAASFLSFGGHGNHTANGEHKTKKHFLGEYKAKIWLLEAINESPTAKKVASLQKKNLQCYFCCSAHDPFGLLFPCRVFSLSQGAQVHDFQFVEDSQLDFGCRVGCCCHLFSCQPTVDSADAAGQSKRDCVCQPAV